MKFNTIVKLFTALAAAVGAIYIVATYGDKIVEWAKGIMGCCCKSTANPPAPQPSAQEADFAKEVKEEPPVQTEEVPEAAPEAAAEEPAEEAVVSDDATPVADEEDFEG